MTVRSRETPHERIAVGHKAHLYKTRFHVRVLLQVFGKFLFLEYALRIVDNNLIFFEKSNSKKNKFCNGK